MAVVAVLRRYLSMWNDRTQEDVRERIDSLRQGVDLYCSVALPARNLARRTRLEYERDLADVAQFLEKRGVRALAGVRLVHLEEYQAEMDRRGYRPSTRQRKTIAIRSLFSYLHRAGLAVHNLGPMLGVPRVPERLPRALTRPQYRRIVAAAAGSARDTAIIQLFLQGGLRLAELVRLRVSDVDTADDDVAEVGGSISIQRTGDVHEELPMNGPLRNAMAAWLRDRPPSAHTDALFVGRTGHSLSARRIQGLLQSYGRRIGLETLSPYTLRHTHAVQHLLAGTRPDLVQQTLGLRDRSAMSRYRVVARNEQRRALEEHAL